MDITLNFEKFPIIFFIFYLIFICRASLSFIPGFYKVSSSLALNLYNRRFHLKYFSYYLANCDYIYKLILLFCLVIFMAIAYTLYFIMKQRMSVPELKNHRYKNTLFLLSTITLIFSFILLSFGYSSVNVFSKIQFKIVDNIAFYFFMTNALFLSWLTRNILLYLTKADQNNTPVKKNYVTIQHYLLISKTILLFACK